MVPEQSNQVEFRNNETDKKLPSQDEFKSQINPNIGVDKQDISLLPPSYKEEKVGNNEDIQNYEVKQPSKPQEMNPKHQRSSTGADKSKNEDLSNVSREMLDVYEYNKMHKKVVNRIISL